MVKQGILERYSSWIIPIIAACVAGLGVFYTVKGNANEALTLAKKTEVNLKKHCDNDVIIRRETASEISEINVSITEIQGKINSIILIMDERAKQDASFNAQILQELQRIKK